MGGHNAVPPNIKRQEEVRSQHHLLWSYVFKVENRKEVSIKMTILSPLVEIL